MNVRGTGNRKFSASPPCFSPPLVLRGRVRVAVPPRAPRFVTRILFIILALSCPAFGQVRICSRPGDRPMITGGFAPPISEDAMGGVYVRDSAIAMEKLALARRMERLHEWN